MFEFVCPQSSSLLLFPHLPLYYSPSVLRLSETMYINYIYYLDNVFVHRLTETMYKNICTCKFETKMCNNYRLSFKISKIHLLTKINSKIHSEIVQYHSFYSEFCLLRAFQDYRFLKQFHQ